MIPVNSNNNQNLNPPKYEDNNQKLKIGWLLTVPFSIINSIDFSNPPEKWFDNRTIVNMATGFVGGCLFKYLVPTVSSSFITFSALTTNLLSSFLDNRSPLVMNAFTLGMVLSEFVTNKPKLDTPKSLPLEPVLPVTSIFNFLQTHLDKIVVGQNEAKNLLAKAVATHYERLKGNSLLSKGNILLMGPTGSGKTLMIKSIAEALKLPFATVDASRLTPEGHIGPKFEDAFRQLYENSNFNMNAAEKGIIFIDEIDKLFKNNPYEKNSCSAVQNQLLAILQGGDIRFKTSDALFSETKTINTKNILFVMAGSFGSLTKETKTASIVTLEDLINYGLSPEFAGRLGNLIQLHALTKEDYRNILFNESSPISLMAWIQEFRNHELVLKIDDDVIEEILNYAFSFNTGARGLDFALRQLLESVLIESLERKRTEELPPGTIIPVSKEHWLKTGLVQQKHANAYLPSLREIKEILDQNVIAQQEAKNIVAEAIYIHFCQQNDQSDNSPTLPKSNVLLVGPSGTGKTLIMDVISKNLSLPLAVLDASRITREGIVGAKTSDAVVALLEQTKGNIKKAERGIIFLDEIDKVFNDSKNAQTTIVGGSSIQNQLLSMLQGTDITVKYNNEEKTVNTKNILFVFAGAFSHLTKNPRTKINDQSLLNSGITPEFLGRIGYISQLHPLTHEELKKALSHGPNALLTPWINLFKMYGVQLTLSQKTQAMLVANAKSKTTGIRGLQFELRKLLTPHLAKVIELNISEKINGEMLKIQI